jgi:restriction system protein
VEAPRASAGLTATTSFFRPEAKQFQEEIPLRLGLKDYFDLQTMLTTAARS